MAEIFPIFPVIRGVQTGREHHYKGFPTFVKQNPAVVNRAAIEHGI